MKDFIAGVIFVLVVVLVIGAAGFIRTSAGV